MFCLILVISSIINNHTVGVLYWPGIVPLWSWSYTVYHMLLVSQVSAEINKHDLNAEAELARVGGKFKNGFQVLTTWAKCKEDKC